MEFPYSIIDVLKLILGWKPGASLFTEKKKLRLFAWKVWCLEWTGPLSPSFTCSGRFKIFPYTPCPIGAKSSRTAIAAFQRATLGHMTMGMHIDSQGTAQSAHLHPVGSPVARHSCGRAAPSPPLWWCLGGDGCLSCCQHLAHLLNFWSQRSSQRTIIWTSSYHARW
jgi:hypothetical protein